eukprot:2885481-Rhodomonas_salina.1
MEDGGGMEECPEGGWSHALSRSFNARLCVCPAYGAYALGALDVQARRESHRTDFCTRASHHHTTLAPVLVSLADCPLLVYAVWSCAVLSVAHLVQPQHDNGGRRRANKCLRVQRGC